MPLTMLTTLSGSILMLLAWFFIGQRIRESASGGNVQVRLLRSFFLYLGIFMIFMFIPQTMLTINPSQFPIWMAWGYTVGHIFMYISFVQILRMTFSMVPRLADKQRLAIAFGVVVTIVGTLVTGLTMIGGTHPAYDAQRHVTLFNAAPAVGIIIALSAFICILPAAILLTMNGIRNPSRRIRSFLLALGFYLIITAGPLHDNARTWQLYTIADILTIVGMIVITSGVVYRLEERIGSVPLAAKASA